MNRRELIGKSVLAVAALSTGIKLLPKPSWCSKIGTIEWDGHWWVIRGWCIHGMAIAIGEKSRACIYSLSEDTIFFHDPANSDQGASISMLRNLAENRHLYEA